MKKSPTTDSICPHLSALAIIFTCLLSSCGGSGSSSDANNFSGSSEQSGTAQPEVNNEPEPVASEPIPTSSWQQDVFQPDSLFKNLCASPRSGASALTGVGFPDQIGETLDENNWLRSWVNDTYLWYDEVTDRDPSLYTTEDYFPLLKTEAVTASGKDKDEFHFTVPTDEWEALSLSGSTSGYGFTLAIVSATPPREVVVLYNQPGSPAAQANLNRGARILAVDGADLINGNDVDTINAGLFPESYGESHDFTVMDFGGTEARSINLVSGPVTTVPVQQVTTLDTDSGKVGYLLFTDHIATAEQALVDAVNQLNAEGIRDLVLDLRYNGGGFLAIASQLAYMIAGDTQTNGRVFESLQFNNKHPVFNPVTGDRNDPIPFYDTSVGFSVDSGMALPTLNLSRVYVLTTSNTCSASESIINSLRGIDVEVVLIGSTTCGKPYGFYATDNCGTTYFSVQFQSINDVGFGEFADGFAPSNASSIGSVPVTGCFVEDDLESPFASTEEPMLAMALQYRETGSCPAASEKTQIGQKLQKSSAGSAATIAKPQWRNTKVVRRN